MKKKGISFQNTTSIFASFTKKKVLWLSLILIIIFIAYRPILNNEFTNWDDNEYVTDNPLITELSFSTIKTFFTEYYFGIYHPVTMLSFALNYHFGNLDPGIYYITSILLHLLNTGLVFGLIFLLIKRIEVSFITAALFGVATIHVEPVAWLAARKDLLSAMFFLLSLICYLKYIKIIKIREYETSLFQFLKNKFYYFSFFLFLLSVLSKGTAVSLTITLFAIDYLFGRKFLGKRTLFEKIPFLSFSLFFGIIAIQAPKSVGAFSYLNVYSFFDRLLYASYGFVQYIGKSIIPYKLSAFYPYPEKVGGTLLLQFWFYPLVVLAMVLLLIYSYKRFKLITFAILFFIINIALLLQLLPLGGYIMADRYAYIPSIGIFLILAVGYKSIIEKSKFTNFFKTQTQLTIYQAIIRFLMAGYIIFLIISTNIHCKVWKNSLTLWNDVISKYKNVTVAWNNRGLYYKQTGNLYQALADYNQAIKVNPEYIMTYSNRGVTKKDIGDLHGAIADFKHAIKINPNEAIFHYNLGITNNLLKKSSIAHKNFNNAIRLNPTFAQAYCDRGISKVNMNNLSGALDDFNKAIELSPKFVGAYTNLGVIFYTTGNFSRAISNYNIAIKLSPQNSDLYIKRGLTKIADGQKEAGCKDLNKANSLGLASAKTHIQKYCLD